jgi:hypothetical protein
MKKDKSWRLTYVRWSRRSNWLVSFFYVFFILVPLYYEYKTEIPPDDALQKMKGTFLNKHIGKAGYLVELSSGEGKETFTCRKNLILGNRTIA